MMVRGPLPGPGRCAYCIATHTQSLSIFTPNICARCQLTSLIMQGSQMQGKTVFITGATDGIGLHTAKQLAKMGADVLVHGRRAPYVLSKHMAIDSSTLKDSIGLSETFLSTQKSEEG